MTMPSAFENLCGPGKPLRPEPPDAAEFAGPLRSGLARLKDAGNSTLALESRFDLAYNAAHALCLAALRWHGYRSGNRYILAVRMVVLHRGKLLHPQNAVPSFPDVLNFIFVPSPQEGHVGVV